MNLPYRNLETGLTQIMRTPLVCASEASVQVAEHSRGSELVVPTTPESRMAKMKKKISSPLARRKLSSPSVKTFGVPLEDLLRRNPDSGSNVPFIVTRIVDFILKYGIRSEGIFRISGSMKVIEKLKLSFDKNGDADLEESGDVMAVAGLLKLFLRELPDSPIPEEYTSKFIKVQQENTSSDEKRVEEFRSLLHSLPESNYHLVKYLICFLVKIAIYEDVNKMNAKALAIVFGPNLFRCSDGMQGLKDQQHTNLIVGSLLQNYDQIFKEDGEESPYATTVICVEEVRDPTFSFSPKMKQRTGTSDMDEDSYYDEEDGISPYATTEFIISKDRSPSTPGSPTSITSLNKTSDLSSEPSPSTSEPIYATVNKVKKSKPTGISNGSSDVSADESEEPYIRSMSPTWSVLKNSCPDSKPAHSESKGTVDRIISETVKEHLFGGGTSTDETSQESDTNQVNVCSSEDDRDGEEPPLPPRKYLQEQNNIDNIRSKKTRRKRREIQEDDTDSGMKENRISDSLVNKDTDEEEIMETTKPKRRPKSKAFDVFENKGLLIGATDSDSRSSRAQKSLSWHEGQQGREDSTKTTTRQNASRSRTTEEPSYDFDNIDLNSHSSLTCLTRNRAPPPKNRRKPTLKKETSTRQASASAPNLVMKELRVAVDGMDGGPPLKSFVHPLVEEAKKQDVKAPPPMSPRSPRKTHMSLPTSPRDMGDLDEEDVDDIPLYKPRKGQSALSRQLKKFHQGMAVVPPLELFKLQQEGDEIEAAMPSPREKYEGLFDEAMLSPRSSLRSTVEQRSHLTECPPSPPNEQMELTWLEKRQEISPTGELSVKQLTKRIHLLKKKIKDWEDSYWEEHGREASQSEKAAVMKYTAELGRAKKQLKEVKDKAKDSADRLNETAPATSVSADSLLDTVPQTVEQSLERTLKKLQEKRKKTKRPEEVEDMSQKQLQEEKIAVQKALLQHESIFGRPTTKKDKEVMRPLYDRYRLIKRRLATAVLGSPPRGSREGPQRKMTPDKANLASDLVPILEDTMLMSPKSSPGPESHIGMAEDKSRSSNLGDTLEDDGGLGETLELDEDEQKESPGAKDKDSEDANLHELSIEELIKHQETTKRAKKRLRVKLREFEDNFLEENGRKVQKEDRLPLDKEYHQYKQMKARLRLLEALISKRQMSKTI